MRHLLSLAITITLTITLAVLALGESGFPVALAAQETSPSPSDLTTIDGGAAELDAALQEALIAGDADAVSALFTPHGIATNPFGVFAGPEAIRAFITDFVAANPGLTMEFSDTQVMGTTAVHRLVLSSDPIRAAGLERIILIHTLVAQDGKLSALAAVFDLGDEQTRQFATRMSATAAQPSTPTASSTPITESNGIVGSWRVSVSLAGGAPETDLGTFGPAGTLVTSVSPALPALPDQSLPIAFTSTGHGMWETTSAGKVAITFVVLLADAQGTPLGAATVRGSVALDPDGQTFHGEVVRTLTDAGGNTLASIPATVAGERIVAEAPSSLPAGTPTA